MVSLTLPLIHWGNPHATRKALMVHGLGSSAHTCWQVMEALAEDGWSASAVDLRGHGSAPRASKYQIADFAEDLGHVWPEGQDAWDVVIGHSIGAASAVVASATNPDWTKKLVLIDPALKLSNAQRDSVLDNQRTGHLIQGVDEITALFPHWHPLDVQLKVQAHQSASLFALEHAVFDNDPWDVTHEAHALKVPTHVLGAEPDNGSMFCGDYATDMLEANQFVSYEIIPGSGHSVHRDKPGETIAALRAFLV